MSGYSDDDYGRDDRDLDRYGRDDREDGDDRGPGDRDSRRVERAREKVAAPALMLILASLLGLLIEFGFLGLIVARPTIMYDFLVKMVENQPPGPERQKQLDDLKRDEAEMRLDSPMNVGSVVLGLVVNLVSVVGGVMMRKLSGYPVAVTGAVCGILPLGGCCLLTLPVGIWALVVLMSQDVKAGFAAKRRLSQNPDPY